MFKYVYKYIYVCTYTQNYKNSDELKKYIGRNVEVLFKVNLDKYNKCFDKFTHSILTANSG